ncbi:MAG TPA: hypothetical protein VFF04_04420 [Candidatus Babeliales bacterium]|nr:hypothetical protein [Candidatus Babeliales bacterium]
MNWKEQLKILEQHKEWDLAIDLMKNVITENPNNVDAYLYMNYLLMNLLVEEDHDESKHDYYETLLKHYFEESYTKFSDNAEYLFYTGVTAYMSEWYMGLKDDEPQKMLDKAMLLDPNNLVFKRTYYIFLDLKNPKHINEVYNYANLVLEKNSPIRKALLQKGSLGEYIFGMMEHWSKDIIKNYSSKIYT